MQAVRRCFCVLVGLPLIPAFAAPLTIINPSFEDDFAADNTFPVLVPNGWNVHDPEGIQGGNDAVGILNPNNSTFFPDGAPDGNNVALIFAGGEIGGGEFGLWQELSDPLEPGVYTLRVWVGDIDSGIGAPPFDQYGFYNLKNFPGYRVELWAGDERIMLDDNTLAATLEDGEFEESVMQVVIPANDVLLGSTLEIRLINLNVAETPDEPGIEVDFDLVRLGHQPTDPDGGLTAVDCIGGPDTTSGPCAAGDFDCADLDLDGDVDLRDHAELAALIGS